MLNTDEELAGGNRLYAMAGMQDSIILGDETMTIVSKMAAGALHEPDASAHFEVTGVRLCYIENYRDPYRRRTRYGFSTVF